ncbi:TIGR04255 family protein [Limimaricola cinnabarinus]|uniref:TIGR04255 family protein n=1 Tax=Limimaricola cinnabarinus TaxID=1125964 RepID=UPI0013A67326|nr:TIGR04255 family protein [Limimaricola cinnabarinus]
MTQPRWQPLHGAHAIERARLTVSFREPLPRKLSRKLADKVDEIREEIGFGARNVRELHQISLGPNGAPMPQAATQTLQGWDFRRLNQRNDIIEMLVHEGESISFETADYGRWEFFKGRFLRVMRDLLVAASDVIDISQVSIEYIDRFSFDGAPNNASLSSLLVETVLGSLPEPATSGGQLWHLHRGWFEPWGRDQILINQNFDAQDGQIVNRGAVRSVRVITKADLRPSEIVELDSIDETLEELHKRSNKVFAEALHPEVREVIGLELDQYA